MDKQQILQALTPEIVEKFRTAIALDKWENGVRLSEEQRHTCMQAVILWEHEYLPQEERTGYIHRPAKESEDCDIGHDHHYPHVSPESVEKPIQFKN